RYRASRLKQMLQAYAPALELDTARSRMFWEDVRSLRMFQKTGKPLWRISMAPTNASKLVHSLSRKIDVRALYDWSAGLICLETPPLSHAPTVPLRRPLSAFGRRAPPDPGGAAGGGGDRRVPAARPAAYGVDGRAQAGLRSGGNFESRPHVRRDIGETMQTKFNAVQLADPTIARA